MDGQAIWIYCNFLFAQQQQLQNRSSNNNSINRSQPEEEEDQQQPINILLINIQPGLDLLLFSSLLGDLLLSRPELASSIIIIKLKFHNLLGCVHGGKIITCTTTAEGRGQRLYQSASCSWERVSASVAASAVALADGLSLQRQPLIYAEIYDYRGIKERFRDTGRNELNAMITGGGISGICSNLSSL